MATTVEKKNPEVAEADQAGNYLIVYPNILKADASQDAQRRALTNLELLHPAAGVGSTNSAGLAQMPMAPFNDARSYKQRADFQSKVSCVPNSLTL